MNGYDMNCDFILSFMVKLNSLILPKKKVPSLCSLLQTISLLHLLHVTGVVCRIHVHGPHYLSDPDTSSYVQYWESHTRMKYLKGKIVAPNFLELLTFELLLCMLRLVFIVWCTVLPFHMRNWGLKKFLLIQWNCMVMEPILYSLLRICVGSIWRGLAIICSCIYQPDVSTEATLCFALSCTLSVPHKISLLCLFLRSLQNCIMLYTKSWFPFMHCFLVPL
jgi:hypothetical protein